MSSTTLAPPRSAVLRAAGLRHRPALLTLLVVTAALALALLVHGWYVHDGLDRTGAAVCDRGADACHERLKQFLHGYGTSMQPVVMVLQVLGGSFGAFVGGPLLAREFEQGTVRFVWTQGAGRARWTAGSLVLTGGVLVVVALLVGLLLRWWSAPLLLLDGRFSPSIFEQTWPALVGRVLLTFGAAALAGAVLRRTVAAVGVGLAVSVALPVVAESLRFHYRQPLEAAAHSMRAMAVDDRWIGEVWFSDPAGNRITTGSFYGLGDYGRLQSLLRDGGYTAHEMYQPADRFWQFQFIELGWMAALGVAACAAAVWWVRRRAF
ncbi:hypothetical protein AB0E96_17450 [Kitasatospora sp. NPDC036755]|uniref:hypothetical protein n=1 Tax=Kitasatospora sp. NPDC036755 TaxID=3154600 RepID=UPI0033CB8F9F